MLCRVLFRHGSLTGAQQQLIRETLMKWLQSQVRVYSPYACMPASVRDVPDLSVLLCVADERSS